MTREPRRIVVLGSTGSVGRQTLEVVASLRAGGRSIEVAGLAAGRVSRGLADQAAEFGATVATAESAPGAGTLPRGVRHVAGPGAAAELIRALHAERPIDLVVGAIVGVAGLAPTLAAVELGIDVALANKETLVAAGELVVPAAARSGARLLPLDSEHSALWQCLQGISGPARPAPPMSAPPELDRLILTASGGALRDLSPERVRSATPAQALAHPTWSMGPKVTVDSASLMNKGLEVIEAHWLFGVPAERIAVLIHPGSVVHSLVEFVDGSVLAQLGTADMRTPIRYALTFPDRAPADARLDLTRAGPLEFREPDLSVFPALGLAYAALRRGGSAGAALNAANEEAVGLFLDESNTDGQRWRLGDVVDAVAEAVGSVPVRALRSLGDVMSADAEARAAVQRRLGA